MPVGKSGKYYMNPHQMRRDGDDGAENKPVEHGAAHDDQAGAEQGDGNHHHEIHDHGDGTAHSIHTHPDGRKDEADSPVTAESMTQGDEPVDDGSMPDDGSGGDGDDMAGMYAKGCE